MAAMSGDARETVTGWLTGADTCFLLGAGCSKCDGKPLSGDLPRNVMQGADDDLSKKFNNLKSTNSRPATVEDLLTYLARCRDILNTVSTTGEQSCTTEQIDSWLAYIKRKIVENIADGWSPNDYYKRFLKRLRNPEKPRDVFGLNYDTILEASLDDLRLPYTDGFRGTNRAWFDVDIFNEENTVVYRLFKLHGSVNWTRDADDHIRRNFHRPNEPAVVYPSEQKYIQTQYGVYETLMGCFRSRLRSRRMNNCLVVLGYSFNDEHINEAICDSVNAQGSNLTVISFVGPEKNTDAQNDRLCALESRCDSRFNAFVGDSQEGHFIGSAVDPESDEVRVILEGALWKFENLVDFIAGEGV